MAASLEEVNKLWEDFEKLKDILNPLKYKVSMLCLKSLIQTVIAIEIYLQGKFKLTKLFTYSNIYLPKRLIARKR